MSYAEETRPCLVFTGASESKHVLDLEKFNRITFGENSMTITHSDHPENQIELLYSAFHRFQIGNDIPTVSGLDEIPETDVNSFFYDSRTQLLSIKGESETIFSIGIFNVNGTLVCRTNLRGGESVSLETLEPAVYIAVAVNGKDVKKIKFVK